MNEVLYAAVTLAKNEQIRTVGALRSRLTQYGFSDEEINEGLQLWADYAARTN
jgi:hypothetical protein